MALNGRKILVVEDDCLIADDLSVLLRQAGAEVVGPAASLPKAMRLIGDAAAIDAAVLDINLREVSVYPLVDELRSRGTPMLFLTGYGEASIPEEYRGVVRCEKPMSASKVVDELHALLSPERATA